MNVTAASPQASERFGADAGFVSSSIDDLAGQCAEQQMATTNERLMQWLHDAQAMEKEARIMLASLARHIGNYPEVKAEAKRVLQETQEQASVIQDAIERCGGDTANLKEAGQPGTEEQSLSGAFVGTAATKRSMATISGYNIVIAAAADAASDSETRAVCEEILRQEEVMVEWLKNYLASSAVEYLSGKRRTA